MPLIDGFVVLDKRVDRATSLMIWALLGRLDLDQFALPLSQLQCTSMAQSEALAENVREIGALVHDAALVVERVDLV